MKRSLSKENKAKEFNSRKLRKVTAVNKIPPHLPDIVVDKVLGHLATNESLRMSFLCKQWRSVWSYFQATNPVIDFDEGGENDDHKTDQHKRFISSKKKHKRFMSSLRSYLVQYDEDDQQKGNLDKLRLNMTRYLPEDADMVSKLLFISFKRGVKELEMSLYGGGSPPEPEGYYTLSPSTLATYAKSLTALKLDCVRVKEMNCAAAGSIHLNRHRALPFLKTTSLKNVDLDSGAALYVLMMECPAIEHLSFVSCSFEGDIVVRSSSLKSLQVKQCEAREVYIKAVNLESLTILSSNSKLDGVSLTKCFKF